MSVFKRRHARERSVDDLMLLRKFREAEKRLREMLEKQRDPHLRVKLGNALREQGRGEDAVAEYLAASDQFLENGFTDRARAAAMRARKIVPQRDDIEARFRRLKERKRLDFVRGDAVGALLEASRSESGQIGTARIEIEQLWDRLSETELVQGMDPRQLLPVLRRLNLVKADVGKRLVAEGAESPRLLVIVNGEVEARRISPKGSLALREFGPGDILGERALLRQEPWRVSVVAKTAVTILELDRGGFEAALVGNSDPRSLIESLRQQRNDDEIARLVNQLG